MVVLMNSPNRVAPRNEIAGSVFFLWPLEPSALDSQKALFLLTCNRFYIVETLHNVNFVCCEYCWDKKEYKRKLQKQRL